VYFGNGYDGWDSKYGNYYVRLVRSEQCSFCFLPSVTKVYGKLHSNSATGAVLANATVSIGTTTTKTAPNGDFSLTKIAAGQQIVNFAKPGYQSFSTMISVPKKEAYTMGNRWLVQNGSINPTIAQAPMTGLPGTTFTQWGTGFTPKGIATLHFKKPDGSEYPTLKMSLDSIGHLETTYRTPINKPAGVYSWWAVDNSSQKISNTVTYSVTQPSNICTAPTDSSGLLKISNATCMDKWNLAIFYKERYNGFLAARQNLFQKKINGTLDANSYVSIGLDLYSSIDSIKELPNLNNKDIGTLVGIGTNQGLQLNGKTIDNQLAEIWLGLLGAGAESWATQNPTPIIKESFTTGLGAVNNLLATISVTTLTKRYQEIEIAKQYLLEYYQNGSQMNLVLANYGLPAGANLEAVIKAIANKIGAKNEWYWFNDYDVNNVASIIRNEEIIVSMKQSVYSN
jgi:hypothetical protein